MRSKTKLKGYHKFLEIWKNADFESAEINDAKSRIENLESVAKR